MFKWNSLHIFDKHNHFILKLINPTNLNFHMEKGLWKLCQILLPQFRFMLKLKISILELIKIFVSLPINKIWKANNSMEWIISLLLFADCFKSVDKK